MLNNQLAASEWDDNLVSQSSAEQLSSPLRCLRNGKNSRRFFSTASHTSAKFVTSGIVWKCHHIKNSARDICYDRDVSGLLVFCNVTEKIRTSAETETARAHRLCFETLWAQQFRRQTRSRRRGRKEVSKYWIIMIGSG